jgi:hypothetical protein
MVDWTIDIFFNRDVTRLKMFSEINENKKGFEANAKQKQEEGETVTQ